MSDVSMSDVRMRGFSTRVSCAEFAACIDAHIGSLPAEQVPLAQLSGRVLAERIVSEAPLPTFARAAMDGYAVRGHDTFGATDYNPLTLVVRGEVLAGHPYPGTVGPGEAVRIMTGAPLPTGADAVLMAEYAHEVSIGPPDAGQTQVQFTRAVSPAQHVGRIGEDLPAAAEVFRPGRRLRPQDVGLLAALGRSQARVVRQPRVLLLITGDEILPPGSTPSGCQIVDSNSPMLSALIARDGGVLLDVLRLPDRATHIAAALQHAQADLIISSGGTSVGQEDHLPVLLTEHGTLWVHGVNLRPAAPSGFGQINGCPVCLLPGNPVACLAGYDLFGRRMLTRLGGQSGHWPYPALSCELAESLQSALGRTDYVRLRIFPQDNAAEAFPGAAWAHAQSMTPSYQAVSLATKGASNLSSTTFADGFTLVADELEGLAAGSLIRCWHYD